MSTWRSIVIPTLEKKLKPTDFNTLVAFDISEEPNINARGIKIFTNNRGKDGVVETGKNISDLSEIGVSKNVSLTLNHN